MNRLQYFVTAGVFAVSCIAAPLYSQDSKEQKHPEDLYMLNYNRYIQYGFYSAAVVSAAQFRGGWGALAGGRAALVVDHIFAIGAGFELSLSANRGRIDGGGSTIERAESFRLPKLSRTRLLYGGGYLSYHIFSDKIVNFSLGALAGWGRCGADYAGGPGAKFFILEPEAYVYVNLPKYARIGIGTSYRVTWGARYRGITDRDLRGFSIGLQVQAGLIP